MNDQTSDGSYVSISRRTILKAAGGVALIGTVPGVGAANTLEIDASSPRCGELRVSATGEGDVLLLIAGPVHARIDDGGGGFTYPVEYADENFTADSEPVHYTNIDAGEYVVLWSGSVSGRVTILVEACPNDPHVSVQRGEPTGSGHPTLLFSRDDEVEGDVLVTLTRPSDGRVRSQTLSEGAQGVQMAFPAEQSGTWDLSVDRGTINPTQFTFP
jgi:hypothetical protein